MTGQRNTKCLILSLQASEGKATAGVDESNDWKKDLGIFLLWAGTGFDPDVSKSIMR